MPKHLLAISDTYIPYDFMRDGLASLKDEDVEVEVRRWEHESLVQLQEANLQIESGGPEAVVLPEEITSNLEDVEIIVVQFAPVSRHLIDAAPNLKTIGVLRGGVENVDVPHATSGGIQVLNTPGRNARAVAECAFGMLLAEFRNIARSHERLKHGVWTRDYPNKSAIPEVYGKTIGLVGCGMIGRLMAGYVEAFGGKVLVYDPFSENTPGEKVDLDTLLKRSDAVSLHARLTEESQHVIGERELSLMKPSAVLINTARSGLIDEAALVRALQSRGILGAALDVFDTEPIPDDHPLLALDNVTLTPHMAGSTIDAFRNSPCLMAEHLKRMFRGETDIPIVNG